MKTEKETLLEELIESSKSQEDKLARGGARDGQGERVGEGEAARDDGQGRRLKRSFGKKLGVMLCVSREISARW